MLLSALWDEAFDRGLVSFADDGAAVALPGLSGESFGVLLGGRAPVLAGLSAGNRARLRRHREVWGV